MVSFWPFKSGDTSAAEFEKVLSSLSDKINKISAKDARFRSQQRRYRALCTLYSSFIYLLALLILVLVVGFKNWNINEYTGLTVTPFIIYGARLGIDTYYNYRLNGTQSQLEVLTKQREDAIEKLKASTKYNSTQQLLDKYGGKDNTDDITNKVLKNITNDSRRSSLQGQSAPGSPVLHQRTGIPPPATANIGPRYSLPAIHHSASNESLQSASRMTITEEFAPNAYSPHTEQSSFIRHNPIQNSTTTNGVVGPAKWYDRLMDVILGDDETSPKNRIVLLCNNCRLINGQAPPGTKSLQELGKWKCFSCGADNGVENEVQKVVEKAAESETSRRNVLQKKLQDGSDEDGQIKDEDGDELMSDVITSSSSKSISNARRRKK